MKVYVLFKIEDNHYYEPLIPLVTTDRQQAVDLLKKIREEERENGYFSSYDLKDPSLEVIDRETNFTIRDTKSELYFECYIVEQELGVVEE